MGIRDTILEAMKARAEGRVVRGEYYPPGSFAQRIGDLVATIGALALLFPAVTFTRGYAYPLLYPGIDSGVNFALWILLPFLGGIYVVISWLLSHWLTRVGTLLIGLIGTSITGTWAVQLLAWGLFGAAPFPPEQLGWLGIGNLVVLVGGLVSACAALFGEWAKRYDV